MPSSRSHSRSPLGLEFAHSLPPDVGRLPPRHVGEPERPGEEQECGRFDGSCSRTQRIPVQPEGQEHASGIQKARLP
jgi:hypothetical protein